MARFQHCCVKIGPEGFGVKYSSVISQLPQQKIADTLLAGADENQMGA